ncbi:MAG TPA: sensor histidine kinase [Candidatus Limnocylindrales bacterium]
MDDRSRRRRIILLLVGLVAIIAGPIATYQLTLTAPRSAALILADVAVGWSMIAAGLIICDRRPGNRIGPLAVLTGFAWFAGDLTSASSAPIAYLAAVFHGWFDPLFAILILAYPTGRLLRPLDRWLAIGFVVVQGAWTLTKAYGMRPIAWWPDPTSPDTVDAWIAAREAMDAIGRLETAALTALSVGVLLSVAVRWLQASGAARRRQTPVVLAGIVLVLGFTGGFLLQTIVPTDARTPAGELRVLILAVLRILVAVALLVGILRDDAARGRIATLVVRLDGLPSTAALQESLRDALGDPSLEVFRWVADRGGYEDAAGRSATPPAEGPARTTMTIDTEAGPALAIAFDPVLRDDPGLVSAAVAAVRLSVENERLQAEVRSQLDAVQASRARLVDAQDAERRRMERDLHDGAQQRLVSLRISLELLRRRMGPDADPGALVELDAAAADARAAIDELRELARGLHPAVLAEGGLRPALESLAERSSVPTTLSADLDGPIPPAIEATVYFVVAEALTNTAKYADARTAAIRAQQTDSLLHVEVSDDGRGGADPSGGTGLRGLEDRVGAVGGTMRVVSPPGGGTTISVDLPCASS